MFDSNHSSAFPETVSKKPRSNGVYDVVVGGVGASKFISEAFQLNHKVQNDL